ncbi:hypothetical protein [Escherichia coli]|uniref:hypothetical protein n=1 Tax=Escherichia coli TaxID=562 RepID=UPI0012FFB16B|nr:hypothetical protein [Escherichia coli]
MQTAHKKHMVFLLHPASASVDANHRIGSESKNKQMQYMVKMFVVPIVRLPLAQFENMAMIRR